MQLDDDLITETFVDRIAAFIRVGWSAGSLPRLLHLRSVGATQRRSCGSFLIRCAQSLGRNPEESGSILTGSLHQLHQLGHSCLQNPIPPLDFLNS